MSIKKFVTVISILALSIVLLIIYPSTDKSVNAGPSKSIKDVPSLANLHRITVSSNDVLVHYFGKDVVDKTMKQPGCAGVRMYYGKNVNGKSGFVIVGIDKNGKDMVPVVIAGPLDVCPPYCGN
ncbi:MAG: hypothetical protein NTX44_06180 [Ignavibacteriales bacterium]|nr:hypothetical protein [Ignavibacteriales bacterium]